MNELEKRKLNFILLNKNMEMVINTLFILYLLDVEIVLFNKKSNLHKNMDLTVPDNEKLDMEKQL